MSRALVRTSRFVRAVRRVARKRPHIYADLAHALELLADDAFHPTLKTHKLTGALAGSFACRVTYDVRIIFEFVDDNGAEAILLQTVGTHDQVY